MLICNDPLYSKEVMDRQKEKPERRFGKEKGINNFLIGASEEEKGTGDHHVKYVKKIHMILRTAKITCPWMLEKDQGESPNADCVMVA